MENSNIVDHLPVKSPHLRAKKTIVASGRVPSFMYDKVSKDLNDKGLSWSDFMTACFAKYLEEIGIKYE